MFKKISVLVLLFTLIIPVIHAQENLEPRFEEDDCVVEVMTTNTVECGWLTVPEEHTNTANTNTIRLAVMIFKSTSDTPAPDPLVIAQGGPGGSTIELYSQLFALGFGSEILAQRDVILFDQRGTLYTEPNLMCPEVFDMMIETLDQDLTIAETNALETEALSQCRTRLISEGVNLNAYDSVENAADVASLREALGYETYNFYGVSYGTMLAQHLLRDHPEGLRSVIMDANAPLHGGFITEMAYNAQQVFNLLFKTCTNDAACEAAYPDLENTFYKLVQTLNETPGIITLRDPETNTAYDAVMNGDTLMGFVFSLMYQADVIPDIPRLLTEVRAGNYDELGFWISQLIFPSIRSVSAGMEQSVLCAEDVDFAPDERRTEGVRPEVLEVFEVQSYLDNCAMWQVELLDDVVDEVVVSDVPTLVLSSEFDPITPPRWGEQVAAALSNSFFYVFPAQSHGVFLMGPDCPNDIIDQFLADPTTEPDSSCIAAMPAMTFDTGVAPEITLEEVTLEDYDLTVLVPQGWDEISTGVFTESTTTSLSYVVIPGAGLAGNINLLGDSIGAEGEAELLEERAVNDLNWSIYEFQVQGAAVDIAITETDSQTYVVILTSLPSDNAHLYQSVLLPAIDSVKP